MKMDWNDLAKDLRFFEHCPPGSSCFLCGKNTDTPCVLIGVDGTSDGSIEEAQPIHLRCLMDSKNWRINRGMAVIYGKRK